LEPLLALSGSPATIVRSTPTGLARFQTKPPLCPEDRMASAKNTKLVSHIDCAGGGQVWIDGNELYIGHMQAPTGTTVVDISDPKNPKTLARVDVPEGWHSHKVRTANGIMIVNHEAIGKGGPPDYRGGLAIYDVSRPSQPKFITKWETQG